MDRRLSHRIHDTRQPLSSILIYCLFLPHKHTHKQYINTRERERCTHSLCVALASLLVLSNMELLFFLPFSHFVFLAPPSVSLTFPSIFIFEFLDSTRHCASFSCYPFRWFVRFGFMCCSTSQYDKTSMCVVFVCLLLCLDFGRETVYVCRRKCMFYVESTLYSECLYFWVTSFLCFYRMKFSHSSLYLVD